MICGLKMSASSTVLKPWTMVTSFSSKKKRQREKRNSVRGNTETGTREGRGVKDRTERERESTKRSKNLCGDHADTGTGWKKFYLYKMEGDLPTWTVGVGDSGSCSDNWIRSSVKGKQMMNATHTNKCLHFWSDCKAIPAYGLMMSVCLSVCPSVRPSVNIWLTSAFKFVLGHINQYRLDTLHGNRPWWDLLNCNLSLWPWPWLFLFKVT